MTRHQINNKMLIIYYWQEIFLLTLTSDSEVFPVSPHSHPDSPHSYPGYQHSQPHSPHSHPDSPHLHPYSPHSHHSVPRFPTPVFTYSRIIHRPMINNWWICDFTLISVDITPVRSQESFVTFFLEHKVKFHVYRSLISLLFKRIMESSSIEAKSQESYTSNQDTLTRHKAIQ